MEMAKQLGYLSCKISLYDFFCIFISMRNLAVSLFVISFFGVQPSVARTKRLKKAKSIISKTTAKDIYSQGKSAPLCRSTAEWPSWYFKSIVNFQFPENTIKPKNYRLLKANELGIMDVLKKVQYDKPEIIISLPIYVDEMLDCKQFRIERVRTMDDELQAKYPMLMSFKATEEGNPNNTARIDTDGKTTKFMIIYNNETCYLTQIIAKNETLFVAYAKNDPNFSKKPFESK
jgi:hypothetical protein